MASATKMQYFGTTTYLFAALKKGLGLDFNSVQSHSCLIFTSSSFIHFPLMLGLDSILTSPGHGLDSSGLDPSPSIAYSIYGTLVYS